MLYVYIRALTLRLNGNVDVVPGITGSFVCIEPARRPQGIADAMCAELCALPEAH